jgi:hypothetical protein
MTAVEESKLDFLTLACNLDKFEKAIRVLPEFPE